MSSHILSRVAFFAGLLATLAFSSTTLVSADTTTLTLQSTTSTENSGLLRYLLPKFEKASGIAVRVVAVGTGQALKNARNGDGDALLVHAKSAEEKFVAEGWGVERFDVMYNDFVLLGPEEDPADIARAKTVTEALTRIASKKAAFLSRGDDSGTHKAERRLWAAAKIDPTPASGTWYREAGSGMGATINTAIGMRAYVLTDRATWISFQNKSQHKILFEGNPALFNQYGIILVNPDRHPRVKAAAGAKFQEWLLSKEGQAAIAAFKVNGQQLFYPNAKTGAVAN